LNFRNGVALLSTFKNKQKRKIRNQKNTQEYPCFMMEDVFLKNKFEIEQPKERSSLEYL
jgi:hypothetical protein